MTPLAGFILAVIAGWMTRSGRRAAALLVVPFLAVTAVQTYGIAAGDGHSPPSSVWPLGQAISYYVVQALILALSLGVAVPLGALRGRQLSRDDGASRRRMVQAASLAGGLTAIFIVAALLIESPVRQHSASGSPPWYGVSGILLLVVCAIALMAALVRGRWAAIRGKLTGQRGSAVTAIVAVAALALALAGGVSAARAAQSRPASAASGGIVHVFETGVSGPVSHDVIVGFIADHGTDHVGVLDHGKVNRLVLTKGSFEVNVSKLQARLKVVSSDPAACTLILQAIAPVTLSHGTGKYRGIHGTLRVTVRNAVVFPRRHGKCYEQLSAAVANLSEATGSGRVSL